MFPRRRVPCQSFVGRTRSASIGGTMKVMIRLMVIVAALFVSQLCMAQAPAGAPAGSTGLCNDGTYFKGSVKIGACTGHKGLKTWWGAAKATATTPAKTAKPAKGTPAPATTPALLPHQLLPQRPSPLRQLPHRKQQRIRRLLRLAADRALSG